MFAGDTRVAFARILVEVAVDLQPALVASPRHVDSWATRLFFVTGQFQSRVCRRGSRGQSSRGFHRVCRCERDGKILRPLFGGNCRPATSWQISQPPSRLSPLRLLYSMTFISTDTNEQLPLRCINNLTGPRCLRSSVQSPLNGSTGSRSSTDVTSVDRSPVMIRIFTSALLSHTLPSRPS